jgi:hypothetical protein
MTIVLATRSLISPILTTSIRGVAARVGRQAASGLAPERRRPGSGEHRVGMDKNNSFTELGDIECWRIFLRMSEK